MSVWQLYKMIRIFKNSTDTQLVLRTILPGTSYQQNIDTIAAHSTHIFNEFLDSKSQQK